ncbi:MAG TPA: DUF4365 domain-containing protein [Chitinophagales bacterium]|nr:DUF4365 domain-containing protein [Chitinophagales bacterium]
MGKTIEIILKKKRTRAHIIEDLSLNYVERLVLKEGHVVDKPEHDYGYDYVMTCFSETGEIENGNIFMQLKASDHLLRTKDKKHLLFTVSNADLKLWTVEPNPVIFILYDALKEIAYWLYVQPHLKVSKSKTQRIRIPVLNRINSQAIRKFVSYKNNLLNQQQSIFLHRG